MEPPGVQTRGRMTIAPRNWPKIVLREVVYGSASPINQVPFKPGSYSVVGYPHSGLLPFLVSTVESCQHERATSHALFKLLCETFFLLVCLFLPTDSLLV